MSEVPSDGLVEVHNEHPTQRIDESQVIRLVEAVCEGEGKTLDFCSVVLADHQAVHTLNRDFLQHDYETDVLSFSLTDAPDVVDGEVYVDLDTAEERAPEFDTVWLREAMRYVAHGVLHLAGYDDATLEEKAAMHALEDRYLAAVGL